MAKNEKKFEKKPVEEYCSDIEVRRVGKILADNRNFSSYFDFGKSVKLEMNTFLMQPKLLYNVNKKYGRNYKDAVFGKFTDVKLLMLNEFFREAYESTKTLNELNKKLNDN
jgi:hypothetical protein